MAREECKCWHQPQGSRRAGAHTRCYSDGAVQYRVALAREVRRLSNSCMQPSELFRISHQPFLTNLARHSASDMPVQEA